MLFRCLNSKHLDMIFVYLLDGTGRIRNVRSLRLHCAHLLLGFCSFGWISVLYTVVPLSKEIYILFRDLQI